MAELRPVLSLVLGYWESSVVVPVYDRDHQGFQHLQTQPTQLAITTPQQKIVVPQFSGLSPQGDSTNYFSAAIIDRDQP